MTKDQIKELKNRIIEGGKITVEEAIKLTKTSEIEYLCDAANEIREHFTGNKFDLCSITNAKSGNCSEDCKWCSQSSAHKTDIKKYEYIDKAEAVEQARNNFKKGVHKYSLVTSGHSLSNRSLDKMIDIYQEIQKDNNIELCASMGLLNKQQMQKLKDNGIKNYHCNLETASSFFPELCSTHTIEEKKQTLQYAREVGMKICSGGIIGMGESMEQRVEFAFDLKSIDSKSIPINFLNPIPGTALENATPLTDNEILISIAMFRFVNPDALIRFGGGRLLVEHIEERALKAGINAALVGDLLTTVGKNIDEDLNTFKKMGFDYSRPE